MLNPNQKLSREGREGGEGFFKKFFSVLRGRRATLIFLFVASVGRASDVGFGPEISVPRDTKTSVTLPERNWVDQTEAEALRKSAGCLQCHKGIENHSMHTSPNVVLGCTDCHGGNPTPGLTLKKAHV